ncbi:bifunctional diaminohydroxyphosphoribosylaminopyrimidine deaminase/5-amino-6-(5-phosphoribosylamino)uracil reductase RibD [Pseudolysobacter antarcticus]|uniref:Riboflavin biosynthesis protein RibD n=1 Tax=Pseudolysobacter antarcticus TaxID=2511995 RepID=A0A411HPW3_9GAMM|nr:bifunctional diaminohydroxyphosphoribosylaminopyrimidine deaminase/5-amino-6-(5-phosphoribosylamino)uracil reductase RibD [Pseudolysobacter antarcticus]QBB72538.1 bifunctional diaminohydroxyphosphoribosylaminopyrimidine deaminase/5-amino-6-(5-phosphoribosylamino)uracil reductase RibD [Pseudolysobacter antarcticus]
MAHALRLAERGLYTTAPNPRVGCVLAHGDEIVGSGWHQRAGEAHAEVLALREAGGRAYGAIAYVTLEPCAHHGRTPPCADALIAAGVARVVVAIEDPFAEVAGRGIARLRDAGITVDIGLLREQAYELNRGFFSRIQRQRPWLRVKLAMSLDGRTALANGQSQWITGEAARTDVQRWRARSSAILTGSGTALADNPRLTVRLPDTTPFQAPLRVLLDTDLRVTTAIHLFDASVPTLVYHDATPAQLSTSAKAGRANIEYQQINRTHDGRLCLTAMLQDLAAREINELHVEAGPTLCGALIAANLVDELLLYIAPCLLGDSARPLLVLPELHAISDRSTWRTLEQRQFGPDIRLLLRPNS